MMKNTIKNKKRKWDNIIRINKNMIKIIIYYI